MVSPPLVTLSKLAGMSPWLKPPGTSLDGLAEPSETPEAINKAAYILDFGQRFNVLCILRSNHYIVIEYISDVFLGFFRSSKNQSNLRAVHARITIDHAQRPKGNNFLQYFMGRLVTSFASTGKQADHVSGIYNASPQRRIGIPGLKIIHRAILSTLRCMR